jgi:hypothetical protein
MVRRTYWIPSSSRPGDAFNESLLQLSLEREGPECSCNGIRRHIDVKSRTIEIAVDFALQVAVCSPSKCPHLQSCLDKFHLFGQTPIIISDPCSLSA